MTEPRVVYESRTGDHIDVDREFYGRLANHTKTEQPVNQFIVPRRSGKAWSLQAVDSTQELLEGWEPRPPVDYSGGHGLRLSS